MSLARLRARLGDRWIPWSFVGAFATVILANAALIFFSIRTFPGLAVPNAYERGLDYNRALDAAAAQDRLGWRAEIDFVPRTGELRVTLRDPAGAPLHVGRVTAAIDRPLEPGLGFTVELAPREAGLYAADITLPRKGQWSVRIEAVGAAGNFSAVRRIEAP